MCFNEKRSRYNEKICRFNEKRSRYNEKRSRYYDIIEWKNYLGGSITSPYMLTLSAARFFWGKMLDFTSRFQKLVA